MDNAKNEWRRTRGVKHAPVDTMEHKGTTRTDNYDRRGRRSSVDASPPRVIKRYSRDRDRGQLSAEVGFAPNVDYRQESNSIASENRNLNSNFNARPKVGAENGVVTSNSPFNFKVPFAVDSKSLTAYERNKNNFRRKLLEHATYGENITTNTCHVTDHRQQTVASFEDKHHYQVLDKIDARNSKPVPDSRHTLAEAVDKWKSRKRIETYENRFDGIPLADPLRTNLGGRDNPSTRTANTSRDNKYSTPWNEIPPSDGSSDIYNRHHHVSTNNHDDLNDSKHNNNNNAATPSENGGYNLRIPNRPELSAISVDRDTPMVSVSVKGVNEEFDPQAVPPTSLTNDTPHNKTTRLISDVRDWMMTADFNTIPST